MTETPETTSALDRHQRLALILGVFALAISLIGFFTDRTAFMTAYLCGFMLLLGISVGSLALVMLHNMTGGEWGLAVRRIHESAALTLPVLAIAFIPILICQHRLFPWARQDVTLPGPQAFWLNPGSIVVRAAVYFIVWCSLAYAIAAASLHYDRSDNPVLGRRIAKLSAAGILMVILTITFAITDWIMSREAGWFSTIAGFIFTVGMSASAMMFAVLLLSVLGRVSPLREYLTAPRRNDLGNLMLTLVILWTYMSFAQLLIVYMGNIEHETGWYIRRGLGQEHRRWVYVGVIMLIFHFFVPFVLLLWKKSKRNLTSLTGLAAMILLMRLLDVFWWAAPTSLEEIDGRHVNFTWITLPIAMAALWFVLFVKLLKRRPLLARAHDEMPDAEPVHG